MYQLEIPLNTPLYRDLRAGTLAEPPPSWDVKRARVKAAFERLEQAGYLVRSAYAAVRDPRRHRFVYQDAQYHGADLLSLGAASFSYLGGVHAQNKASLRSYLEAVSNDELPLGRAHSLTDDERLIREFVLQLKLGRADADYFLTKFRVDIRQRFIEPLTSMAQSGWLTIDDDGVTMTRGGLIRVDRLIPEFYSAGYKDVRYS
jgi:oxygen-independent coproporphyrinogen-3 oxidase